ncbi:hypothetical protein [Yoonia sp. F2084L]|nr:hypothetical protein [Yoonia sp. F2084L]
MDQVEATKGQETFYYTDDAQRNEALNTIPDVGAKVAINGSMLG